MNFNLYLSSVAHIELINLSYLVLLVSHHKFLELTTHLSTLSACMGTAIFL